MLKFNRTFKIMSNPTTNQFLIFGSARLSPGRAHKLCLAKKTEGKIGRATDRRKWQINNPPYILFCQIDFIWLHEHAQFSFSFYPHTFYCLFTSLFSVRSNSTWVSHFLAPSLTNCIEALSLFIPQMEMRLRDI